MSSGNGGRPSVDMLTGFLDYDRDSLPGLSPAERVDYFEKRVRLVAITPLRRLLRTEIIVGEEASSAILIFGVSAFCAVEALGKFLKGSSGGNGDRFRGFLRAYMSPEYAESFDGKQCIADVAWAYFRNGIAHGFAVSHGGFEGTSSQPYFQTRMIAGQKALEINPTKLHEDLEQGFEHYLVDLRAATASSAIRVAFDDVFEKVFIRGG